MGAQRLLQALKPSSFAGCPAPVPQGVENSRKRICREHLRVSSDFASHQQAQVGTSVAAPARRASSCRQPVWQSWGPLFGVGTTLGHLECELARDRASCLDGHSTTQPVSQSVTMAGKSLPQRRTNFQASARRSGSSHSSPCARPADLQEEVTKHILLWVDSAWAGDESPLPILAAASMVVAHRVRDLPLGSSFVFDKGSQSLARPRPDCRSR